MANDIKKTKEELILEAKKLGIKVLSSMKKEEIALLIENEKESEKVPVKDAKEPMEVSGILEILSDGFGFLRSADFRPSEKDCYVSPTQIRRLRLRAGDFIVGDARLPSAEEDKFPALIYVKSINSLSVDASFKRPNFEKLTPVFPNKKFRLENEKDKLGVSRILDLISPVGKGQRGMIVAPPKAGKTTLIKQIAKAIEENYPEAYLIVLLVDERPEEVTDIKRSIKGRVVASTFDMAPENHTKISELVLEHAQRLVEVKKDVVILLDSITRLARAYNLTVTPTGKTLSGGLDPDALIKPKKFFGAARNIDEGGSLTILATALVETGSRMDDVIFEEFKGTGNMEIKLSRTLQERRIFPAIDILKSGTRREDLLFEKDELSAVYKIRQELSKKNEADAISSLLGLIKNSENNNELIKKF